MYSARPEQHLSSAGQSQLLQLLQLLLLSDRYQVPRVFSKVVAALQATCLLELEWSTVAGIYAFPAGCAEMLAFKPVFELAADKLQEELGDLELVWHTVNSCRSNFQSENLRSNNAAEAGSVPANISLQEQYQQLQRERQRHLLQLPLPALKHLLQDPRTRVASENTVWYTVDRWCRHHGSTSARKKKGAAGPAVNTAADCSSDQRTADMVGLAGLVRLPHCSASYIPMVISSSSLASSAFTAEDLAVAALVQQQPQLHSELCHARHPVIVKFPAWQLGRRPDSSVKFLRLQWKLPLQQLCSMVDDRANNMSESAGGASDVADCSQTSDVVCGGKSIVTLQREQTQAWCGLEFGLAVTLGQQGAQQLLSLVCVMRATWGHVHQVRGKITIAAVAQAAEAGQEQQQQQRVKSVVQRFSGPAVAGKCTMPVGWASVRLGQHGMSSGAELVQRLKQLGLVHGDGCLHMAAKIEHVD
jgi:hypothetical protein